MRVLSHDSVSPSLFRSLSREIQGRAASSTLIGEKPVYVYGAGALGRLAIEIMESIGVRTAGVIDADPDVKVLETCREKYPVSPMISVPSGVRRGAVLAIAVAKAPYSKTVSAVDLSSWSSVCPVYDILESKAHLQPVRNGWRTGQLDSSQQTSLELLGDVLSDDASRAHYLSALAWHTLQEDWIFRAYPAMVRTHTGGDYWIPEFRKVLEGPLRIIDVGAYHGSFLEDTISSTGQIPCKYLGLEPDPDAFRILSELVGNLRTSNEMVEIQAVAAGKSKEALRFWPGLGYASQGSPLGSLDVDQIVLGDLHQEFNFVKIHCESMDLEVLEGARDLIAQQDCSVACTIYHDPESFFGAPHLMSDIAPGRRIVVRQHAYMGTGVVAYSVPT
jgi:FkbM family methyltransferase